MLSKKEILIVKFLTGSLTPDEQEQFEKWLNESPLNRDSFDEARKAWEISGRLRKEDEVDVEAAWSDFRMRTENTVPAKQHSPRIYMKVAAAVALVAALSLMIIFYVSGNDTEKHIALSEPVEMPQPSKIEVIVQDTNSIDTVILEEDLIPETELAATRPGKSKRKNKEIDRLLTVSTGDSATAFLLPDESVVFLNSNSKVVYSENFGKNNRKLSLTGEAYFEVARDTMQFTVACFNSIVRGDKAFNVKGYPADAQVEVLVVSGSVKFSGVKKKEYKTLELEEGEKLTFNKKDLSMVKSKAQRKEAKWWQKKNLRAKLKHFFDKVKRVFKGD